PGVNVLELGVKAPSMEDTLDNMTSLTVSEGKTTVRFSCPKCFTAYEAPIRSGKRTAKCPKCAALIQVVLPGEA
ncbi:MAG: zinc-ribbon domain-containing protein, partial [Planctomycetales bacterium]